MSYSVFLAGYGRTFAVRAAVRIIPSHEKWPTEADPSFRPAIYASAYRIVQPPDDRTYSAEVTAYSSAISRIIAVRAVFPYTRPIMIPSRRQFVKCKFRRNHKVFPKNSAFFRKSHPRRHPASHTGKLVFVEYLLSLRASALKWRGNPPAPWNQVTITTRNCNVSPLCRAIVDTFLL